MTAFIGSPEAPGAFRIFYAQNFIEQKFNKSLDKIEK